MMVGAAYSEIIAATSVPVAIAALHPDSDKGRVFLYSESRELAPGNLPTMELALELASTMSRHRDEPLLVGPVAPADLVRAGLTIPPTSEHRDGPTDLEAWVGAVTSPGDLVVVPIHDTSIGPDANRVYRTQRSVLAVIQNANTSLASVATPMTLTVGRSLGS
jgi:hypothetical protein